MALAPFFDRVYSAVGGHLEISRESLSKVLNDVVVGIRCDSNLDDNDSWIAELSINLIARLYPRIAILGQEKHCDALKDIAQKINPKIDFSSDAPLETSLCIGKVSAEGGIFPSAKGFVARVGKQFVPNHGISNPYSSGAAAAFACAQLFNRIFLKSKAESDIEISLLKYDAETGSSLKPVPIDIGSVLFVGVGAIGNAALWALSRDKSLSGQLILIDHEDITRSNLQRYVLAKNSDIGRSKVELGRAALKKTGIKTSIKKLTLEAAAAAEDYSSNPTTMVSVDNVDGRRTAQALLPRLIINGWTGDQALGASWHVFSRDVACLACLYHPHGQGVSAIDQAAKAFGLPVDRATLLWVTHQPLTDGDIQTATKTLGVSGAELKRWRGKYIGDLYTEVVCGTVPLDVTGLGKIEMVPLAHQSALAGILMAVELLKRTHTGLSKLSQSEPLVSWDNVLDAVPKTWCKPRAREIGCVCGDPDYQKIYAQKWMTAR